MKNMLRYSKIAAVAAMALMAVACGRSAKIDGTLKDAPSSEVVVKLLDINTYKVLDTLKTDASGHFSYKAGIEPGQPEFIYLFYGERKIASLLLEAGDKVNVTADTLGKWEVVGSEESAKLGQVESEHSAVMASMANMEPGQLVQEYIRYYRDRVKYVMQNPYSLTVVPVLYQTLAEGLPLFGQNTDAIHFSNAADSLATVYPDSKYVKALRSEADRRLNQMQLLSQISSAEQVDFLDVELPDVSGQKVKMSDVHNKITLLYFWTATDAAQKMFNLDVLAPVYKEFHSKGFEIYQVALDPDKGLWAKVVKEQKLPWTNVCDGSAGISRVAALYNVAKLPSAFIIGADGLEGASFSDAKSLRKLVAKQLK